MNKFKIVVPMYNVEKWVANTINTIKKQTYTNFDCVIIDDISTDDSYNVVKELIEGDDRFHLIKNTEKKFALQNIYEGIEYLKPANEDIVATVDGDDWLYTYDVLEKVNKVYEEEKCFITFGMSVYLDDLKKGLVVPNGSQPFPPQVVHGSLFRDYRWQSSHLRTFKYGLWKRIKREDLLDEDGEFYRMAWDLAFMFPMLEMAMERHKCITDILYVYNNDNPLNDHKVDTPLQLRTDQVIRKKQRYHRIEDVT